MLSKLKKGLRPIIRRLPGCTREEADRLRSRLRLLTYERDRYRGYYGAAATELWGASSALPAPAPSIPAELMPSFSMNGRIPVKYSTLDGRRPAHWPLIYTDPELDRCIEEIASGACSIYRDTDDWLRSAFRTYPVEGKSVAVIGSIMPWFEAMVIHFGGSPTTIDYNPIITRSSRLRTLTVAQCEREPVTFDAAISISSFEHDGLGAYGDPLDPDGDLRAMRKMKSVVRPGALLYLSVPVGRDLLDFNHRRVYGRLRLPLLLEGWQPVAKIGFRDALLDDDVRCEPVFVLRNPS